MTQTPEKILVIETDPPERDRLVQALQSAGYETSASLDAAAGQQMIQIVGADLLVLDANLAELDCCQLLSEVKGSTATSGIRVILVTSGEAPERVRALDLGADDVLSRPWESAELLARVRAQLRIRRELEEMREARRIAEEGQEMARNAFQALAVTEKMTRDAFSLDRMLKIGVSALLVVATIIAGFYFVYTHRAEKENKRAYALLAQFERGVASQRDLVAETRRMREQMNQAEAADGAREKQRLEQQSAELRQKMAATDTADLASLRQQLSRTNDRLRRMESESRIAENIIRSYAPSVCLLHVVVAFREPRSGRRLRFAGVNPEGGPLKDSQGNPILTLDGSGPMVRADFFGTGFLVAKNGVILTNRHVAEPWWKNDDLKESETLGVEPVISSITAYFPDAPKGYRVEIQKLAPDADLATVQGNLEGLNRPVLSLDGRSQAAVSGEPLVSVGYATGLAAILARAGDDTVDAIMKETDGSPNRVMEELARRGLIRPLTTQGHIGDVLSDKIVYDAQTTSGGSGGPLFNQQGKVIGVTFAVVKGFGGSNFGIPIRLADSLLGK